MKQLGNPWDYYCHAILVKYPGVQPIEPDFSHRDFKLEAVLCL
jgi:hypothetical protein